MPGSIDVYIGSLPPSGGSQWADATNTGYQNAPGYPGSLSTYTGSDPITTNNATFDFKDFPGGIGFGTSAASKLTGATFNGCRFRGLAIADALTVAHVANCTWNYCTFAPSSGAVPVYPSQAAYTQSYQYGFTAGGPFTSQASGSKLSHCDFWGFGNAIEGFGGSSAAPNLIEWCWIHGAAEDGDSGAAAAHGTAPYHTDGIGMTDTGGSLSYLTVDHCTLSTAGRFSNGSQRGGATNGLAWQQGTYDHVTVTNNLFSGWGYAIAIWATSSNVVFTDNTYTTTFKPSWGVVYPQSFFTSNPGSWRRNRWKHDPAGEWGSAGDDGKFWIPNTGSFDTGGTWTGSSSSHVSTSDYTG